MMRRGLVLWAVLCAVVLGWPVNAQAQTGALAGTVRNTSASPLSGISVRVYRSNAGSLGYVGDFTTGSDGAFSFPALTVANGPFFLLTYNNNGYVDQIHRASGDPTCLYQSCDILTTGTGISLTAGETTTIDFSLAQGGTIAGTVTDAANGNPLAWLSGSQSVTVELWTAAGEAVIQVTTNGSGQYEFLSGLPAGNYFLRTINNRGYIDELFNNLTCVGSPCTSVITSGTPVAVTVGNQAVANFALAAGTVSTGTLRGTVRNTSGTPLSGISVRVYRSNAGSLAFVGDFTTSGDGTFSFPSLTASDGPFFLLTYNNNGYVDQIYRTSGDQTCLYQSCGILTHGSGITVTTGGIRTIDFALAQGGTIAGTVTDAANGNPLAWLSGSQSVTVELWTAAGEAVIQVTTNGSGQYEFLSGLPAGNYFLRTINSRGYIDELHSNRQCAGSACTSMITTGTPVPVTAGNQTTINFALDAGTASTGALSGTVRNTSNVPLSGISVRVYRSNAGSLSYVTSMTTGADGAYAFPSLAAANGPYFLVTYNNNGYVDQVYRSSGDRTCLYQSCAILTTGTGIAVPAGGGTTVDFALAQGGTIGGTVTVAGAGTPLAHVNNAQTVSVELWLASGRAVIRQNTNSLGQYAFQSGLPAGNYFLRTINTRGYIDELYQDVTCVGTPCTRTITTAGTPIAVTVGAASTVNFALEPEVPGLQGTPSPLKFAATKNGTDGALVSVTDVQQVSVTYTGSAVPAWTATSNQPWAVVNDGAGTGTGQFSVSIANPSNIIGGATSLTATITLTAANTGASATVPVELTVQQVATPADAPVGQVDTPLQDSTVQGTIAVTGWVVDDVGVAGVAIYRNCLPFDNPGDCQTRLGRSMVFVGQATFLGGARPDVETAFGEYPAANRGGWGYLLLTSMLPNVTAEQATGGVGPLTLYVVATDLEGQQALLGRSWEAGSPVVSDPTRITMANDSIANPFGAIDTPAQGATIAGLSPNFGWTLTPDINTTGGDLNDILVPTTGTSIRVFIDSVDVGQVTYNQCRGTVGNPVPGGAFCDDDVASLFGHALPQATFTPRSANPTLYRNLDAGRGAIGSFVIDTFQLRNGQHSLAWSVTDSAGRTEGIGSRVFNVLNNANDVTDLRADGDLAMRAAEIRGRVSLLAGFPQGTDGVYGRTGFAPGTPWVLLRADAGALPAVRVPEQGRLELWLGAPVEQGYLVAQDGTLRDLPIGSTVDGAWFGWVPPVGYVGTYRLAFIRAGERVDVAVTIRPATRARPGEPEIRMHLDTAGFEAGCPAGPAGVTSPACRVRVEGWAFDPHGTIGAGIRTVHVWARRLDVPPGAIVPAQFLGEADLGIARPDVAIAFPGADGFSGFRLDTTLAPGQYAVTAYVWNERTGRWEDARTREIVR